MDVCSPIGMGHTKCVSVAVQIPFLCQLCCLWTCLLLLSGVRVLSSLISSYGQSLHGSLCIIIMNTWLQRKGVGLDMFSLLFDSRYHEQLGICRSKC